MFESWFFVLTLLAVLLIPGANNALLAHASYQNGVVKSLWMIPVLWLGYVYGIALWALLIHLFEPIWPALGQIFYILSLLYVFWMVFRLWKRDQLLSYAQQQRASSLFFASFKNPKTVLLAAGIFPDQTWHSVQSCLHMFGVFSAILIVVMLFWMSFGPMLLSGRLKKIKADQMYTGSALLLLICALPLLLHLF